MKLHQFNLPEQHNDGSRDYALQRIMWSERAVELAGGYTYLGTHQGAWGNNKREVQIEPMHVYQVACSDNVASLLTADALDLFYDQSSIFVATIGTARIAERQEVAQAA